MKLGLNHHGDLLRLYLSALGSQQLLSRISIAYGLTPSVDQRPYPQPLTGGVRRKKRNLHNRLNNSAISDTDRIDGNKGDCIQVQAMSPISSAL